MAKSVCIVGAGPAGIIAAKSLLYGHPDGTFKVTVLEQSERIGGLWPLSTPDDGMVSPEMKTNLSRHTVSFSDLAWPNAPPTFPKAWHVGQYLNRYLEKYSGINIQTSCKVTKTSRLPSNSSPGAARWKVEVQRKPPNPSAKLPSSYGFNGKNPEDTLEAPVETHFFDYLIIASGFFGRPKLPAGLASSETFSIPVQHSTQFRNVDNLLRGTDKNFSNRGSKIVVVGGSMSGVEVVASIAMHLSSALHSPTTSLLKNAQNYTVHHVVRRPCWVMPAFIPVTPLVESKDDHPKEFDPAPKFLPVDLVLYNLSKRPAGQITNNSGYISREGAGRINEFMQTIIGTNQSDLTPQGPIDSLAVDGEMLNDAPWVSISDSYAEFVRSGKIAIHKGKLDHFDATDPTQSASVFVASGNQTEVLDDVAAIVLATGFEAIDSLSILPEDVLQSLDYDPECSPLPLSLHVHSTMHPGVPNLGFVGFYRGPFWGVMEMQARFLGKLWTGDKRVGEALASNAGNIPELRKCYYEDPKQLAQFPMGDYVYLMESFKDILGIKAAGGPQKGPVIPARYTLSGIDGEARQESFKALSIVGLVVDDSTRNARFVARAIFRSMQGDWKLTRSLISSISSYPSGKFQGTARFFPRYPEPEYDAEHLYHEEGDFETEQGMKFQANRRYAHRYKEDTDTLSVWFIKSDNKTVDYLFHELEILPPENGSGWRARAHHLCIADTYDVQYEFRFQGVNIEKWSLAYSVKGPSKDYRIESMYTR